MRLRQSFKKAKCSLSLPLIRRIIKSSLSTPVVAATLHWTRNVQISDASDVMTTKNLHEFLVDQKINQTIFND